MKNKFNFLQIANWVYSCHQSIKKIQNELEDASLIEKLKLEKRKISILYDVIARKATLHGINKDFIKNIKDIKKEYGIEE